MFILRIVGAILSVVFATLLLTSQTFAEPPTASPDERVSAVNVLRTIDVLDNDSDPDGDAISVSEELAEQPSHGVAQVRADSSITYRPDRDFVGTDTFSYVLVDATGETSIGRVTITVTDKFIRRNAGPGVNRRAIADTLDSTCNQEVASSNEDSTTRSTQAQLLRRACQGLLSADSDTLDAALASISPEETLALMRAATRSGHMQSSAVSNRLSNLGQGTNTVSVNGVTWQVNNALGGAAGEGELPPLGFFTSIMLESADKDATDFETGYESDGQGITVGVDYALATNLYLGGALGYTLSDLDYSAAAGSMESNMINMFAYLLWQKETFSVDAQLGYGFTDYDIERAVSYFNIDDGELESFTAEGKTGGRHLTFSTQAQYHWQRKALSLSPFVKLNYSQNSINAYSEVNAGGFDVNLEKQKMGGLNINFGFQGQYAINRDWGVIIPTFDLYAISDISMEQDDVNGEFAFAENGSGGFTMSAEDQDSFYFRAGLGASFILPNGFNGFANVQSLLGYEDFESYQYQLGFRYEL